MGFAFPSRALLGFALQSRALLGFALPSLSFQGVMRLGLMFPGFALLVLVDALLHLVQAGKQAAFDFQVLQLGQIPAGRKG